MLFNLDELPVQKGIGGHQSAHPKNDEWLTPPAIIDALGGPSAFDLDPCSPIKRPWPTAQHHFTVEDNGLRKAWFGRVWLNPPYTNPAIGIWLGRLADHGRGTALIFARTETDAFFSQVWERASALLFLRGRLYFHTVDGKRAAANAGAPSVLCAYGMQDAQILGDTTIEGQFVPLRLPRLFALQVLDQSWGSLVYETLKRARGPVSLSDLYRALQRHPKAKANRHYAAKIRQVLQRGPFRREAPGVWALA